MDILNIQALIKEGKIVKAEDIDPSKAYIQIGVFQPGNRQNGAGNANTFAPYVIQLDQVAGEGAPCQTTFGIDPRFLGPEVYFEKFDYVPKVDVIIPGGLEITRGNNQGLYNAAQEGSYTEPSPLGTLWNSIYTDATQYSEGNISNLQNRTYDIWVNSVDGNPPHAVDTFELIMWAQCCDRYFLIKMVKWTPNNNGGGFAYTRQEILIPTVKWDRPPFTPEAVDKVSPYLTLKRDNIRGIYNAVTETKYDRYGDISPKGTRWNSVYTDPTNYGWSNLTNVENRVYGTWREAVNANPPGELGTELIMHDVADNKYYKVYFNEWNVGDGGGANGQVGMFRTLIPLNCGVTFASGKKMNDLPAASGGPVVDGNGNLIVADSSNNTVSVGPGGTHLVDNFSGTVIVNDHYDGGMEYWICGGGDCQLFVKTSAAPGNSTFLMSGSGYEWTNVDNLNGPFTFTVVKTRNGS
jgi:hypothetical protein